MIELKNVNKFYTNNGITNIGLHNISLNLSKNEIVVITGESGSGKSTLLNVITKIDNFDEGEIYYKGNETAYFSISEMDDFRKNKVGFIFQNYNILDSYTVLDNVMLPLLLKGMPKNDARAQAMLLIKKVGLAGREKHRGTKLSGGEKQRCVIARALASDCEILACDEPTGNLDSETAREIINLIKEVANDKLVLIVTHNFPEVEDIATRVLKMADGKIVEDIVIETKEQDENIELNLDYVPLPKKVIWNVAKNNMLFTPRKTILASIMFFVIAFCFLFICQLVVTLMKQDMVYSEFNNTFENHLFVYKPLADSFSESELDGYNYTINGFGNQDYAVSYIGQEHLDLYYTKEVPNAKLVEGRLPENEYEFVVAINETKKNDVNRIKKCLNNYLSLSEYNNLVTKFKLVGILTYESKYTQSMFATKCDKLGNVIDMSSAYYDLYINDSIMDLKITHRTDITKPVLSLPLAYNTDKALISLKVYNLYDYDNIEIKYEITNTAELLIPIDGTFDLEPYFANVFVPENKIEKVTKELESKGFVVIYPIHNAEASPLMKFVMEFLALIVVLEFGAYLIGIFFIVYVILSKIYSSRVKDYEIIRTLGVTKKDMSKIVNIELLLIGMGVSVFAYFVFNGLVFASDALSFLKYIGFTTIIAYFAVMFMFTYLMAKRFNKRLFKFTVRKSMKGVHEDDQD